MRDLLEIIKKVALPLDTTLLELYNYIRQDQGHYHNLATIIRPYLEKYSDVTLRELMKYQ